MIEVVVLCVALGGMLLCDGFAWRGKLSSRDKIVYGTIVALSIYTGIDFAFQMDWPDYLDLADIPFGQSAKAVEQALGVNWD